MGWAGPAQPTGPDSAQKVLGRFRPKYYHPLLGQTQPRRGGWARTNLAQRQTLAGELFSPPSCMQNVIRSACKEKKKETGAVMKGGRRITWRG